MTSGFTDGDDDGAAGDGGATGDGGAAGTGAVSGGEGYGHEVIDDGVADGTVDDAIDRDAIDDDPVDHDGIGDRPRVGGGAADTGGEVDEEAGVEEVDGPGVRACLEAILLVADEPVPEVLLAQVLERPRGEIDAALRALAAEYTADGRGFDLREIAGGWRFYTREDCAPLVERFVRDGQEVRLTQAALETLAVIAYRQPVSRARVSAVRGVNCDGVIRTLVLRGLVEDSGTDQETGAILYRTTGYFLERLGMASLDELPDLAPFLPENIEDIEDNERTRA